MNLIFIVKKFFGSSYFFKKLKQFYASACSKKRVKTGKPVSSGIRMMFSDLKKYYNLSKWPKKLIYF